MNLRRALLSLAVGLAFADASIVVLALPPIYGELGTSVVGTSWIIAVYAAVVAVVAAILAMAGPRVRASATTATGLVIFSVASAACGFAPTAAWLITGRAVQGLGAALLLSAALPELGTRRWALAASIGLAAGPALGGALTQAFDWRSIFLAQAPVAALALVASRRAALAPAAPLGERGPAPRPAVVALVGLSGALVGALFLGVLLIVEVWQYEPLAGAVVVSALPVGMLALRFGVRAGPPVGRAVLGGIALAAGLVGLALLPTSSSGWAALALALCGAGLGLVDPVIEAALLGHRAEVRVGALEVGARHAGLVLGLLLIAPVLSTDLEAGADRAVLAGADTVLEARLAVSDKIDLAQAVGEVIEDAEPGRMPDLGSAFDDAELDGDEAEVAQAALVRRIEEVLTRGFRASFLIAAALAALAVAPAALAARSLRPEPVPARRRALATVASAAVAVGVVALPVAAWRAGGDEVGEYAEADPCAAAPDPYSGNGLDPTLQRIALGALNGAACEIGISRTRLVLSLADSPGIAAVELDEAELEDALEAGLLRAVDDAQDRGSLPWLAAAALRLAARAAPLTLILDGIERLDVLPL